jgi:hypothetical protein
MDGPGVGIGMMKSASPDRQSPAYIGATLATFLIAGLIAYSWTASIDNWFKVKYPNGEDSIKPRFMSAIIITVVAIIVLKLVLRVKKL